MLNRIPSIKKFKIHYDEHLEGDDPYCFSNIKLLSKLESLGVFNYLADKDALCMQKLSFPHSLKSLTLWMRSRDFEWEEMLEKIGWLPLLEKLRLMAGCFGTGKSQVVEGLFPSLKYLELWKGVGLKQWTVKESRVLPCLEQLHLLVLPDLEEIPHEIGDIPTLQKICLKDCSDLVVKSAREIVDEQVKMQGEEELSFHVEVWLSSKNEALQSLASPNFIFKGQI